MSDPRAAWRVVERFEEALCEYTGAPFAVATDSCTNAMRLCFEQWKQINGFIDEPVRIPTNTYVGVPRALLNAGYKVEFVPNPWIKCGWYNIWPFNVRDSARSLKRGMYECVSAVLPELKVCISFHATKHLPIGRGGAILCEKPETAEWLRRARYDGRDQTKPIMEQTEFQWGIHCYMPPESAARGLLLMTNLKDDNESLPGIYPDLSLVKWL